MTQGTYGKQRMERRISAVARLALCCSVVLLQVALILFLTHFLYARAGVVYGVLKLIGAVVAVRLYSRSGSPSYKLSWMCLLLALPVAGMLLFVLWGGTHQAKTLSLRQVQPIPEREDRIRESRSNTVRLGKEHPEWGRVAAYLQKKELYLYRNTDVRYFGDGAKFLRDLTDHIAQAETYVFLEYYILAEGQIWDQLFSVLRERAACGVEVHIIFDDFGNITRLSDEMLQKMQQAGLEVEVFNPVHKYINRMYFNFRDHRKIAVIDGRYAYTGGVNIADEYANLVVRFGHWKDSGIRIEGEAAWGFAAQFLKMWKMIGRSMPNEDDYYRPRLEFQEGHGYCQPFFDGPINNPDNLVEDLYLQLIASAKRFLYITTPYYAVEDSIQKALCIAADSGVDVRLLIPAVPDHKITYLVAETYWGELLRHGVKIYRYLPGFLHAKSVMVDREVALVGSTNMDYRTFQLHYECGALLYQTPAVEELLEDMDGIMEKSERYGLHKWEGRPWYRRAAALVMKLFAIWL